MNPAQQKRQVQCLKGRVGMMRVWQRQCGRGSRHTRAIRIKPCTHFIPEAEFDRAVGARVRSTEDTDHRIGLVLIRRRAAWIRATWNGASGYRAARNRAADSRHAAPPDARDGATAWKVANATDEAGWYG